MTAISNGFELVRSREISEIQSEARLYRHVKTGAGLLSLVNADENKVFGISFRTPPRDSSGVAHILEHSVLCGSRKYPVKEPFVEILKGSLHTFLNAFTYPDKTCYPVASQNLKDFYNLIDVYLDAVFYPRIEPHIFQQEGWHYEMEVPEGPLTYKGVVFNEMKGSYSSPERLLAEYSQQHLFPDTTYGLDSGGNPKQIPGLTFEEFREFHRRYYHPSNAHIFFSGNDDPGERLRLVNEYLKDFDAMAVDSAVPLQRPFAAPRRHTLSFPAGRDESSRKAMVTVNWMLAETGDIETNMALHVLGYILLGTPGSPLRKALIDSGLGEDITGAGLEDEIRQLYFSTGLKGVDGERTGEVETLILDTLEKLSAEGIDAEAVEAAVNTIEFSLRENNTGSYPRGLILMLRTLTTWLYDGDPLAPLAFEAPLASVKEKAAEDRTFFEKMIRRFFLENSHRTTIILVPDPDMEEGEVQEEKSRLAGVRRGLNEDALDRVYRAAEELKGIQDTPDSPDALATIPVLSREDLDRRNRIEPLDVAHHREVPILVHDIPTSGIVYLDAGVNFHVLPRRFVPYVPLFARALVEMGTAREDYVRLSQRIDRKTGGVFPTLLTALPKGERNAVARIILRGKSMIDKVGELTSIMRDVFTDVALDNRARFMQMALEEKARHEQGIVPGGHHTVNARLRAHFSETGWLSEEMNGVSYLFFLRHLIREVEHNWTAVADTLREMQRIMVCRGGLLLNVTVDGKHYRDVELHLHEMIEGVPDVATTAVSWSFDPPDEFEAMSAPTQVNYVGKGTNIYATGYRFHGSVAVITRYLRNSWLWDRIRVQGGAYGAYCLFDRHSGVLSFLSYRDPHIMKTVATFDESARYLHRLDLSDGELTKGIIGAIGDMDAYLFPDARGYTSMIRHLVGTAEEERQQIRDEVLSTTASDFRSFAEVLDAVAERGIVKILASENTVRETVRESSLPFKAVTVL